MASSQIQIEALRLKPGQDVKLELEAFVKTHQIKAASVISAVGSLSEAQIRFANKDSASKIKGPLEIVSLSGTLGLEGSHLHISVSDGTGKTWGGHLVEGNRIYTTLELVLAIYPDLNFKRSLDPTFGYKELDVQSEPKK
jgi:predicted DNA-binding protein with PD1-like motif